VTQTGNLKLKKAANKNGSWSAGNPALKEVVLLFLKLGVIGFGGPAAHIAMMEDEVVRRRGWISHPDFLDLLAATNVIPGPNSTEMAIHLGHRRAGWPGLLLAGSCFILPAALTVAIVAWAYVRYGSLPQTGAVLHGVKPVVMAVILQALWRLTRSAAKNIRLAAIGMAGVLLAVLGVNELLILLAGGLAAASAVWVQNRRKSGGTVALSLSAVATILAAPTAAGTAAVPFGLLPLFLFFLKVGSVLFGSGYVLLAFLRADLVTHWHWLSEGQLLDAVAIGQVTPGPVFTTATFIGYVLGGGAGALVATIGIFLPAFVFVALSGPIVPKIRRSAIAGAALDGIAVTSLSLMAVVTYRLGRAALVDPLSMALLAISAILLIRFRVNSAWLILGSALIGLIFF
jgi:chromate transporter